MIIKVFYYFSLSILFLCIYLKGYFPITYNESIVINTPDRVGDVFLNSSTAYKPQVDRLVLIIIDALRYDFITEDNMPFLYKNMDYMLKLKVEAPTVTMPRIKSLTTGGVPQFVDIILNLGSRAKVEDSFLHRAKANDKKMVFYGDDTWLALFPNLFERADGTTSFFVNDFTEVDNNVTRHVPYELAMNDWHLMFLHYLGLDHIGHIRGPFSSLIKPKLHEMDTVIKQIISQTETWEDRTLILITGDHGMKNSGGHGGTTYEEVHVPLIIHHNKKSESKVCNHNIIYSQTDLSNTISALFGIEMPGNSIGKVISCLLSDTPEIHLYILYYNSLILRKTNTVCNDHLLQADKLYQEAIKAHRYNDENAQTAEKLYERCLDKMSNHLISSSVNQDKVLLLFAIIGTLNCLTLIIKIVFFASISTSKIFRRLNNLLPVVFSIIFLMIDHEVIRFLVTFSFAMVTLLNITKLLKVKSLLSILYALPLIVHGILLPSSSFIEFEELIFYYFSCTVSVIIAFNNYQRKKRVTIATAMPLTVIEVIRFARALDSKWFLEDENILYLKVFHILSLLSISMTSKFVLGTISIGQIMTLVLIYIHKFHLQSSVNFAQFIWLLIVIQLLNSKYSVYSRCFNVCILILVFLLRPYNAFYISAVIICSLIYKKAVNNIDVLSIIHTWLGYTFFYLQGHTNSIANIDIAPGYTGLRSYIPVLVGLLTLCHSYAFPTLAMFLLCRHLSRSQVSRIFGVVITYKLFIIIVIYITVFIHCGHLFVWSVFAPKLIIESMHTCVLFVQVVMYLFYVFSKYLFKRVKTFRNDG